MAIDKVRYFSGEREIVWPIPMANEKFNEMFPGKIAKRYDGYSRLVGHPIDDKTVLLPIDRIIEYKRNPSLHKCDSRCQCAKGGQCECSCGGQYHGIYR